MPVEYVTSDGEKVSIPDKLNPHTVLKISSSASYSVTKAALMRKIIKSKRQDRALASLAYHMITSPSKYLKVGDSYLVKNPDVFILAAMGHKKGVFTKIDADASLVNSVDDCQRTVMYIAAHGGFGDIVELLIQKGADLNKTQNINSTPLHAASFFGQSEVVTLLLVYGADPTVKNSHGHTPYDESSGKTRIVFDEFTKSPLEECVIYFYSSELVMMKNTKFFKDKKIGFELVRNTTQLDPVTKSQWDEITQTWGVAYHGTKLKYLKSILTHGLMPSGSKLPTGDTITPEPGHITMEETVDGTQWAKAIFVSPSILCASHPAYAEYCGSGDSQWCVVLKVYKQTAVYTKHPSTAIPNEELIRGEPKMLEYRFEKTSKQTPEERLHRTLEKLPYLPTDVEVERNVVVASVLFISTKFRNSVKDYNLKYDELQELFK